jgi:UDP-N-acetylmuramoyl-L-alanyl-D-glutamate--2,6-diaminopimelate ligase
MVKPDSIFVAITGFEQDGNIWVDEAISRGAVAVVSERQSTRPVPQIIVPDARAALADLAVKFYAYSGAGIDIYAVTGTNGKTTSCLLITNILQAQGKRTGMISSLVYDTGRDQIPATRTTPESLDVYRLLYLMKKNRCSAAVIEISSHALVLQRVKNLNIKVALFTNITRDHLDFHADMDDYLNAKARLLDMVADNDKWAVINYDCPEFRPFVDKAQCSTMTYSMDDDSADIHLKNYQFRPDGSVFELCTPQGKRQVNFKLTGRYNLYNALGAGSAAIAAGVGLDDVVSGLESSAVIPGRLERIESDAPFTVFIDYAHTPDALSRTVETLKEIGAGRVLTLFGCGGDRDRGKRPMMGKAVTSISDYSVLTSDNPRSENPRQILDDVEPGFARSAQVKVIEDRREAIRHILDRASDRDIVLLAGKGAEDYQEIDGMRHPFSDKEIAIENLNRLGYGQR